MTAKKSLGPKEILFPVPAALVASGTMGRPNLATVAWVGMMGSDPPILAISLKQTRLTLELIRKHRHFTVNIPPAGKFVEVDYCGITSGRDRDKFADCAFTPIPGTRVAVPIVDECPFNIECAVVRELQVNGHTVIFGEILEVHVDADAIDGTSPKGIDLQKIDPLVYCTTIRQYWSIGSKLGDSFCVGRRIRDRVSGNEGSPA
ncbi:MAG: flavin reductase family protein [Spirochaetes bacterium]|nr:flavin reductase family protein [Spirochaetota bacterium]